MTKKEWILMAAAREARSFYVELGMHGQISSLDSLEKLANFLDSKNYFDKPTEK